MREEVRRINRFHWSSSGRRQRFRFGSEPNDRRHQNQQNQHWFTQQVQDRLTPAERPGPFHWFCQLRRVSQRAPGPPRGSNQARGTSRTLEKVPIDGGAPSNWDQASDPSPSHKRFLSTPAVKQAPSQGAEPRTSVSGDERVGAGKDPAAVSDRRLWRVNRRSTGAGGATPSGLCFCLGSAAFRHSHLL